MPILLVVLQFFIAGCIAHLAKLWLIEFSELLHRSKHQRNSFGKDELDASPFIS